MIAKTAVDARALAVYIAENPRATVRDHSDLAEVLRDHGVLIQTSKQDAEELRAAIRGQDIGIMRLWSDTIKYLHHNSRYHFAVPDLPATTSQYCDGEAMGDLRHHVNLLVVDSTVAARQGFDSVGYAFESTQVEMVTLDSIRRCSTIEQILELKELGNYPVRTDRDLVWNQVFAPLAAESSEVTVLDRYLLRGLSGTPASLSHVDWILKRLNDSMRTGGRVRILSERIGHSISQSEYDILFNSWLSLREYDRLGAIEISMAPWIVDRVKGPHNRHMRFSCGAAVAAEEGFDRFRSKNVTGVDGFSWKYLVRPGALSVLAGRERYVMENECAHCYKRL